MQGFAVSQNMPELGDLTIPRLESFLYWYFTRNADHSDVEKFRARLWIPPKGEKAPDDSPWSAKNERQAFKSLQMQFSGAK